MLRAEDSVQTRGEELEVAKLKPLIMKLATIMKLSSQIKNAELTQV